MKYVIKPGDVYGRLTAIHFVCKKYTHSIWLWKCECGREKEISSSSVRRGLTTTCGCAYKYAQHPHNLKHGMTKTKTYKAWVSMRGRCEDEGHPNWADYGGRGISVCSAWSESFEAFLLDMGEAPKGLSLDRVDNNQGYYKENCRWATSKQQNNNRRSNFWIVMDGTRRTLTEWCELLNIAYHVPYYRIKRGWDAVTALTTPVNKYRSAS